LSMLVVAIKKNKHFLLAIFGCMLFVAGILFATRQRVVVSYVVFAMAAIFSVVWIYEFIRHFTKTSYIQS